MSSSAVTTSYSNDYVYERAKYWYAQGLWTAAMLRTLVKKGKLTQEQYEDIIDGSAYETSSSSSSSSD